MVTDVTHCVPLKTVMSARARPVSAQRSAATERLPVAKNATTATRTMEMAAPSCCVVEDGFDCSSGTCSRINCGNGSVDAGETCDDGANGNGDGCSADCSIESGFICPGNVCEAISCSNQYEVAHEVTFDDVVASSGHSPQVHRHEQWLFNSRNHWL